MSALARCFNTCFPQSRETSTRRTETGDLPVEQPTRFDLIVNKKIANALGIKIPNSDLSRADKVIE